MHTIRFRQYLTLDFAITVAALASIGWGAARLWSADAGQSNVVAGAGLLICAGLAMLIALVATARMSFYWGLAGVLAASAGATVISWPADEPQAWLEAERGWIAADPDEAGALVAEAIAERPSMPVLVRPIPDGWCVQTAEQLERSTPGGC